MIRYLYVETVSGLVTGVSNGPPGDNAWTDESDWREVEAGHLKVFRVGAGAAGQIHIEELKPDGTWVEVPGWYRT